MAGLDHLHHRGPAQPPRSAIAQAGRLVGLRQGPAVTHPRGTQLYGARMDFVHLALAAVRDSYPHFEKACAAAGLAYLSFQEAPAAARPGLAILLARTIIGLAAAPLKAPGSPFTSGLRARPPFGRRQPRSWHAPRNCGRTGAAFALVGLAALFLSLLRLAPKQHRSHQRHPGGLLHHHRSSVDADRRLSQAPHVTPLIADQHARQATTKAPWRITPRGLRRLSQPECARGELNPHVLSNTRT